MAHANPTHGQSASELKRQIEAEREGAPFLVLREPGGEQRVLELGAGEQLTLGRGKEVDVSLDGDEQVSRLHARLDRVGGAWVLGDAGLSTNGSFVNGERASSRRLRDGDLIRIGGTGILYREPGTVEGPEETAAAVETAVTRELTETQRRVLVALCRPFGSGEAFATPATNKEIAGELFLSVDAVKGHLRVLFERFEVGDLPQNTKRVKLAETALRSGAVAPRDLG